MLDYLIIGFGISGAAVTYHLEEKSKTFAVIDDESQKASKVAGGLYNPVALKKLSLSWNADQQLTTALKFYRTLEEKLGITIRSSIPIHRKFPTVEEQNNWFTGTDHPKLSEYLNPELIKNHSHLLSDFQFGEVLQTGIIDMKKLLGSYAKYLMEKQQYFATTFDHAQLEIEPNFIQYEQFRAKNIIFCEGYGLKNNPFFNYLPIRGNKGEYILIHAPELKLEEIVKASFFIIPLGKDVYKVGATYEHQFDDQKPSGNARKKLTESLDNLLTCEFSIVDQEAGIRPTSPDRKPMIGRHPYYSNLYICNGFGSRGILMGPSMAKELINFIDDGTVLSPEINISRFSKRWFRKERT